MGVCGHRDVLLRGLAQRGHVGIQDASKVRPQLQLQGIEVGVQAADLPPLHALPVELHDSDHQQEAHRVPAVCKELLQGVEEELRGLAKDLHEELVAAPRPEEVVEEEELRGRRVHEEHLVAAEDLLVVVLDLVFVGVGDDRVLLQLLEDRVPAREREDVALVLQVHAPPQAQAVEEAPRRAARLPLVAHQRVRLGRGVLEL
mmetsp:Transcript_109279/g.290342  ORF Transcript_109279/g.290342 Transcript_109279/m.290342 type:complete len:202 (-) Transcript_109279:132-737(-)